MKNILRAIITILLIAAIFSPFIFGNAMFGGY